MKARNICKGILLTACFVLSAAIASAAVTVLNPSFEIPAGTLPNTGCGTGCSYSTTAPPNWTMTGTGGEFHPGVPANGYFTSIPDGVSVGYVQGGNLSQIVGAVTGAGQFLTLKVDLGLRANPTQGVGMALLYIGSHVYPASGNFPALGTFTTYTATYLTVPADVGQPIKIQLNAPPGGTTQGMFDNVRLSEVDDAFQVQYISNANLGGAINLTNTGTSHNGSTAGKICVNVYVFDPAEEMLACCACPVTPNGLASISAAGLIGNPLTPEHPTSIVVKLLATQDDAKNATCDGATAGGNKSPLTTGMRAWAAALHQRPTATGAPASYVSSEGEFLQGGLSQSELNHLTSFCSFIEANGSGSGICSACQSGALAGAKQE